MAFNPFNPWKDLTKWSGLTLQYQTHQKGDSFITYIRDKDSKQAIVSGLSRKDREESLQRAKDKLAQVGAEGVRMAIETQQMVDPSQVSVANHITQPKDVAWRDGINHSHRAFKKMNESDEFDGFEGID